MAERYIDILFDGPPDHQGGRFVEVENERGQSINAGTWISPVATEDADGKSDGLWRLRIKVTPSLNNMARMIHDVSTAHGFDAPNPSNLPSKLMLSVTELAEAMEEFRDDKPAVYWKCTACGMESSEPLSPAIAHRPTVRGFWGHLMALYNAATGKTIECDGSEWKPEGVAVELADSNIRNLHMLASMYPDLDLDWLHQIKMEFNEGRPMNHGRIKAL
jgi:hypothetical protein